MSEETPPIVYETQVSSAQALNAQMRGSPASIHALVNAESQRDRIQGVLSESGIELVSVNVQPADLGYDERKFTVLGKKTSLPELMDKARESVPNLDILEKTPLTEALESGQPLPFVLKRPLRDARGVNKFLINRPDQIDKLREYCETTSYLAKDWFTEPYIETPGSVNSSYRLAVTATGVVIASALLYQPREAGKKAEAVFIDRRMDHGVGFKPYTIRENQDGWEDFADRESDRFLDADAVTSNVSTGGKIIPLKIAGELGTDPPLSASEIKILRKHGIKDLETPQDLIDNAVALGRTIGPSMALLLGIDFLQDNNGKHHLLEINAFPGTDSILTWWGLDPSRANATSATRDRVSDDLIRVVGDSLRRM